MTTMSLEPRRAEVAPSPVESAPRHRGSVTQTSTRGAGVRPAARLLVRLVGWVVLAAVLAGFAFLAVGPHVLGYRTATMLTGSMEPMISPGDVVVSVPRPVGEVEVGDVISYHIPVEDHRVETHRIIDLERTDAGRTVVQTQGDANPNKDPWTATLEGDVAWETVAVVPHLGSVVRFFRAPLFQTYVFWGALAGMLLLGVGMIWRRDDQHPDADAAAAVPADGTPGGPLGPTIIRSAQDSSSQRPGGDVNAEEATSSRASAPEGGEHLDPAALERLAADVEDRSFALAFARRYQQMLDHRVARIEDALVAADVDAAMDALLSLKVSSITAGTRELAGLAAAIESEVGEQDIPAARRRAAGLRDAAARADRALTAYLAG